MTLQKPQRAHNLRRCSQGLALRVAGQPLNASQPTALQTLSRSFRNTNGRGFHADMRTPGPQIHWGWAAWGITLRGCSLVRRPAIQQAGCSSRQADALPRTVQDPIDHINQRICTLNRTKPTRQGGGPAQGLAVHNHEPDAFLGRCLADCRGEVVAWLPCCHKQRQPQGYQLLLLACSTCRLPCSGRGRGVLEGLLGVGPAQRAVWAGQVKEAAGAGI